MSSETPDRILPAMARPDATTRLCATAPQIRVTAHPQLSAAHALTSGS